MRPACCYFCTSRIFSIFGQVKRRVVPKKAKNPMSHMAAALTLAAGRTGGHCLSKVRLYPVKPIRQYICQFEGMTYQLLFYAFTVQYLILSTYRFIFYDKK